MADEAATCGGIYKPLFLINPRITTVFTIRESHNKEDDVLISLLSLNTRHNRSDVVREGLDTGWTASGQGGVETS